MFKNLSRRKLILSESGVEFYKIVKALNENLILNLNVGLRERMDYPDSPVWEIEVSHKLFDIPLFKKRIERIGLGRKKRKIASKTIQFRPKPLPEALQLMADRGDISTLKNLYSWNGWNTIPPTIQKIQDPVNSLVIFELIKSFEIFNPKLDCIYIRRKWCKGESIAGEIPIYVENEEKVGYLVYDFSPLLEEEKFFIKKENIVHPLDVQYCPTKKYKEYAKNFISDINGEIKYLQKYI